MNRRVTPSPEHHISNPSWSAVWRQELQVDLNTLSTQKGWVSDVVGSQPSGEYPFSSSSPYIHINGQCVCSTHWQLMNSRRARYCPFRMHIVVGQGVRRLAIFVYIYSAVRNIFLCGHFFFFFNLGEQLEQAVSCMLVIFCRILFASYFFFAF